jgi:hypothetical protein
VLFHKSDSRVLNSSGGLVRGVSQIRNVFQADFYTIFFEVFALSVFFQALEVA